jgi:hypothetical protein
MKRSDAEQIAIKILHWSTRKKLDPGEKVRVTLAANLILAAVEAETSRCIGVVKAYGMPSTFGLTNTIAHALRVRKEK